MRDLYSVLGVAKNADQASIKKAFKTLARKYHPDVTKEPGAEEKFKEIAGAYEVIGDEQKRALYDEFGENSLRPGFNAEQARAYKNFAGGFPGGNGGGFPGGGNPFGGGGGIRFEDLFAGGDMGSFFGGGGGGRGRVSKGADIEGRARIPFMVAVRGGEVQVPLRRPAHCSACGGEGGTGQRPCRSCAGKGRKNMGQRGLIMACDECGGTGVEFANTCAACDGTGRAQSDQKLTVRIPAGAETGKSIRLKGQGGEGVRGGPAGDLVLSLEVDEHPLLRRKGKDLELDVPISLSEAIGGGSVEVPTPTTPVRVKIPKGAANGARLRVPGRGVQAREGAGDLYLILRPVIPSGVTEEALAEALSAAQKLDALGSLELRAGLQL
jgi:molecular chaperone DnaJ